jgi:alpha-L-fucosidase
MEMEMFLCIDPCTWQNREYDDHSTPLSAINPDKLDTDQWARVAVSMGAKQILFVAKHTGGFCWWQTDTTDYGVKETPWRGGRGDVMKDLSESCRKAGLKLGVYLSPQDDHYGAKVSGRCETPEKQAVYDKVYRQQLTELLTRYGTISEVWNDGGLVVSAEDILKDHAAEAMIFQGKSATIRWVGNEQGHAPYPAWNAVSREAWQRGATAADGDPNGEIWLPNEVDTVNVSPHFWFWNSKPERKLRSLDELMDCYYRSVGHGAVLLLNQTPDTTGLIPEADARQAAAFGAEVQRRFGKCLAETSGSGPELELVLDKPNLVDHVVTMEDIREGERIREYVVEGRSGTEWKTLARGTAVGHKKIDRFDGPVEISALRLRCTSSQGVPRVRRLAAFHVGAFP